MAENKQKLWELGLADDDAVQQAKADAAKADAALAKADAAKAKKQAMKKKKRKAFGSDSEGDSESDWSPGADDFEDFEA